MEQEQKPALIHDLCDLLPPDIRLNTVGSMCFELYGVDQTKWTPEQLKFYESLDGTARSLVWDDLPLQIERELGDRMEAILK